MDQVTVSLTEFDLRTTPLREVNAALHQPGLEGEFVIEHPAGAHNVAVGVDAPVRVRVEGHVGYYAAGMNQQAGILINGNAGTGVAENMMSGTVRVKGNASQSAGATAHGGLLVVEGDAAARCGISMKGIDIVVGGNIGHMSAFMAQAGRLVVRGNAGEALGDSIYEARIYVRGEVASLGADCIAKPMRPEHHAELAELLAAAGYDDDTSEYARYGSALNLYHFHVDKRQRLLMSYTTDDRARLGLRESATFDRTTIAAIQRAADTGIYDIRGWGAKRPLPIRRPAVPGRVDVALPAGGLPRALRHRRRARRPARQTPSAPRHPGHHRRYELRCTVGRGQGGTGPRRERGRHVDHHGRRRYDARGARPEQAPGVPVPALALRHEPRRPAQGRRHRGGAGPGRQAGRWWNAAGQKISERVAGMRTLPQGIDQRSACRHPDWTGPDDLTIKINELREITDWEKPIYVKVGATRTYYDVKLAVHSGADVVVVDGMQGGTAATQEVFIEHVGIPTLAAIPQAVQALQELGVHRKVQLIVSGGIRNGADVAKALALGADAVAIGTAALIALGDNHPRYAAEYEKIGSAAGFYDDFQDGRDPAGISTQDAELAARFDPIEGGRRLANYLRVLTMEAQTIARACGKAHVCHLEPEDLVAVTIEAAAMARVPLAGTDWIPGRGAAL